MATAVAGAVTAIKSQGDWEAILGTASKDGKAVRPLDSIVYITRAKASLDFLVVHVLRCRSFRAGGGRLLGYVVWALPHDIAVF